MCSYYFFTNKFRPCLQISGRGPFGGSRKGDPLLRKRIANQEQSTRFAQRHLKSAQKQVLEAVPNHESRSNFVRHGEETQDRRHGFVVGEEQGLFSFSFGHPLVVRNESVIEGRFGDRGVPQLAYCFAAAGGSRVWQADENFFEEIISLFADGMGGCRSFIGKFSYRLLPLHLRRPVAFTDRHGHWPVELLVAAGMVGELARRRDCTFIYSGGAPPLFPNIIGLGRWAFGSVCWPCVHVAV
ncbi:unnamed protein product [Linum trigynum]|uniref:Uncharacterized protein n=1 Tax=Linum trigynum TaxID=586398 RepID=A0AAV2D8R1_9ROSI